jgi:predicted ATPase
MAMKPEAAPKRREKHRADAPPHHLDYGIRWQNFRGFTDTDWLLLPPLTILIGANGSGKTSVIAPLLLMNQTMQSRDVASPLVSRGTLFDAGSFRNLLTDHNVQRELSFGIRFHIHNSEEQEELKEVGAYPPGALEITFRATDDPHVSMLASYTVFDVYSRRFVTRKRQEGGHYSISAVPGGSLRVVERKVLRESRPHHFLFNATLDLRQFIPKEPAEDAQLPDFSQPFSVYLSVVSYVFAEIRSLLDDLSYIGPLRERSRHYYPVEAERRRTVGPTGDRAANLFRQRYSELQPHLNEWVQRFELGDEVQYHDLSSDLFEINFLSQGRSTNIADSGFGASQVFPLIIQALASKPGTFTLAEQPEIHLNPRLQSELADLFVEMANSDRRVVVETHSEHLLLRLRRLIAEGRIRNDRVALYFVEKNDDRSYIRRVPIQPNGHIPSNEWPKGFFGETLRESLALASAQTTR